MATSAEEKLHRQGSSAHWPSPNYYCHAVLIPAPHPLPVLPHIEQLWFTWGTTQVPGRLHSDNGTEFCAVVVQVLCQLLVVNPVHGAVGRPQAQGCVERAKQIFTNKLAALLLMAVTHHSWVFQVGSPGSVGWQEQWSWGPASLGV